jgi:hypothetical protein
LSRDSQVRDRNSQNWDSITLGPITLCANLRLRWGLKKIYSLHWGLFNDMLQTTCTQGNRCDSWLLIVGSQIGNLTPHPSFGHNLCFKCPNGSCEPILDIYVSRAFQWYNKISNKIGFDPWNFSLKIWDSIKTPTPQMGAHLGVWGFIPHTFPHSWEHEMWLMGFTFGSHLYKPLPWSQAQG